MNLLVLAWTGHYFDEDFLAPRSLVSPAGQIISIDFTRDRKRLDEVSAVWFHAPSIEDLPRKRSDQPWVLMSMESDVNYPLLRSAWAKALFDITMTYRLDSDIPCIYPNWRQYQSFANPPPARRGRSRGAPAAYVNSNPVKYRDRYVRELMQFIEVDSFGACLKNRQWANSRKPGPIASILSNYKFYLAFENTKAIDYVTERLFRALAIGVVPVYLGAPNVRAFVPQDEAVIVASDFASPKELAKYLNRLDREDDAYSKHLQWKRARLPARFRRLVDLGSVDPMQRLAIKLTHGCDRSCPCGGRLRNSGSEYR